MGQAAVLYDRDCNICKVITDAVLSWDGARGALRAVPIQSEEGQRLLRAIAPERRLDELHLVEADGTVRSGGPAFAALLGRLRGGVLLGRLLARLPGPTAAGYGWVARNRVVLSRFVPGRLKTRADRRLRERA